MMLTTTAIPPQTTQQALKLAYIVWIVAVAGSLVPRAAVCRIGAIALRRTRTTTTVCV